MNKLYLQIIAAYAPKQVLEKLKKLEQVQKQIQELKIIQYNEIAETRGIIERDIEQKAWQ